MRSGRARRRARFVAKSPCSGLAGRLTSIAASCGLRRVGQGTATRWPAGAPARTASRAPARNVPGLAPMSLPTPGMVLSGGVLPSVGLVAAACVEPHRTLVRGAHRPMPRPRGVRAPVGRWRSCHVRDGAVTFPAARNTAGRLDLRARDFADPRTYGPMTPRPRGQPRGARGHSSEPRWGSFISGGTGRSMNKWRLMGAFLSASMMVLSVVGLTFAVAPTYFIDVTKDGKPAQRAARRRFGDVHRLGRQHGQRATSPPSASSTAWSAAPFPPRQGTRMPTAGSTTPKRGHTRAPWPGSRLARRIRLMSTRVTTPAGRVPRPPNNR